MKTEKEYVAHIEVPEVHTTSKGVSYIDPFDVVRSSRGRAVIARNAKIPSSRSGAVTITKEEVRSIGDAVSEPISSRPSKTSK